MDSKEQIFVFGASGHAKVVIDIIERQGLYEIVFLADDDANLKNSEVYNYMVIGGKQELLDSGIRCGIVAIGSNRARVTVATWLVENGFELVSAIHPSAQIARGVVIGTNSVVNTGTGIDDHIIADTAV